MNRVYLRPLVFTLLILIFSSAATCQNYHWGHATGNVGVRDEGRAIAIDEMENTYSTGYVRGAVDFDPGPGVFQPANSSPYSKPFVRKLDKDGNFEWAKVFSTNYGTHHIGTAIELDPNGNIYLIVDQSGSFDADPAPGNTVFTTSKTTLVKLSPAGNFLWAQGFPPCVERIWDINYSPTGHLYIAGSFSSGCDFDPGPGTDSISSFAIPGYYNGFFQKIDTAGNYIWAKGIQSNGVTEPHTIISDNNGNIFLSGYFRYTVDLDPGPATTTLTDVGSPDEVFLAKYSAGGALMWGKSFGTKLFTHDYPIVRESTGNLYILVQVDSISDLAPGPSTVWSSPSGLMDYALIKLDTTGNYLWHKQYACDCRPREFSLHQDREQRLFISGTFSDSIDFESGPGVNWIASPYSQASYSAFLQIVDSGGNPISAQVFSSDWATRTADADLNLDGHYAITGRTGGNTDFDPGPGFDIDSSDTYWDIFVTKYNACLPNRDTIVAENCNSYIAHNGAVLTVSGIYLDTLQNSGGCDSIIRTELTIHHPTSETLSTSTCGSYTLNGQTYTSTGIYTQSLTNNAGCDSTLTINLTVNVSTSGTLTTSVCDSLSLNGQVYTLPGTYVQNLTNAAGCDSTLTINLILGSVDTSVTLSGNTLTANAPGLSYQWLDCDTWLPVSGATSASFTPTVSGNYAVHVYQGNCSDTSACRNVTVVGIEPEMASEIQLFPNPSDGTFTLDLGTDWTSGNIAVINIAGQVIYQSKVRDRIHRVQLEVPAGMYMLRIEGKNGIRSGLRVVVE